MGFFKRALFIKLLENNSWLKTYNFHNAFYMTYLN